MEKENFIEHIENTIEEIKNHFGFDCQIWGTSINVYSFIGKYEYKCQMSKYGHMAEFYRFCYCYAQKLQKYGLQNKIKEVDLRLGLPKRE